MAKLGRCVLTPFMSYKKEPQKEELLLDQAPSVGVALGFEFSSQCSEGGCSGTCKLDYDSVSRQRIMKTRPGS
jgi:hypothetical protein